jgi:hypothetical protein
MTESAQAISTRTTDFPGNRAAQRAWLDAKRAGRK